MHLFRRHWFPRWSLVAMDASRHGYCSLFQRSFTSDGSCPITSCRGPQTRQTGSELQITCCYIINVYGLAACCFSWIASDSSFEAPICMLFFLWVKKTTKFKVLNTSPTEKSKSIGCSLEHFMKCFSCFFFLCSSWLIEWLIFTHPRLFPVTRI